jgi:hypothetical protein
MSLYYILQLKSDTFNGLIAPHPALWPPSPREKRGEGEESAVRDSCCNFEIKNADFTSFRELQGCFSSFLLPAPCGEKVALRAG